MNATCESNGHVRHLWEVEWGNDDWQQAGWAYTDFEEQQEAIAFAHTMLPQSSTGMVRVTPFIEGKMIPGRMYTSESCFLRA